MSYRTVRVNPRKTTAQSHDMNKKAIEKYQRNPGPPVEGYMHRGKLHVHNGAHRRQAAIRSGRRLDVKVYDSYESFARGGGGECCFQQLAKGKPHLARRLAQRWIKMQLATAFPTVVPTLPI